MPELPEVETTCRGIEPFLLGHRVIRVVVRDARLRWPVPDTLNDQLSGQTIERLWRRSKYILAACAGGTLIIHLGMSGSLRVLKKAEPPGKHDHIDIETSAGAIIRYRDPRRFGCFLWTDCDPFDHPLLKSLGPEPLTPAFDGDYLYRMSRGRKAPVKSFIMDAKVVVGVGNIYASESLARSGIHPRRAAGRVGLARYRELASQIRYTLERSIRLGGTTLRDFVTPGGSPGYFEQTLVVYGREGEPCRTCGEAIRQEVIGQRSSFYCARCQH